MKTGDHAVKNHIVEAKDKGCSDHSSCLWTLLQSCHVVLDVQ